MAVKYYGLAQSNLPAFVEVKDPTTALNALQKSVASYEKELAKQQEELQRVVEQLEQQRVRDIEKLQCPLRQTRSSARKERAGCRQPAMERGQDP